MLSNGCEQVYGELVRVWHIAARKRHFGFLQRGDKSDIAGQPVELGDEQPSPGYFGAVDCLSQLRSIVALAALDFDELGNQLPITAVQEIADHLALSIEPEPATALPISRDTQIGYKFAGCNQTGTRATRRVARGSLACLWQSVISTGFSRLSDPALWGARFDNHR